MAGVVQVDAKFDMGSWRFPFDLPRHGSPTAMPARTPMITAMIDASKSVDEHLHDLFWQKQIILVIDEALSLGPSNRGYGTI